MKPLVAKEIRLLLPAYLMALLLVAVPAWVFSQGILGDVNGLSSDHSALMILFFGFGVVMLAISAFGREFSLRTFSMILAQPLERRRIWWTKILLLVVALATLLGLWGLASAPHFDMNPRPVDPGLRTLDAIGVAAMVVVVALSGALWTTLLLRQIMAAFWFTVLIPAAILALIEFTHGSDRARYIAMGIYSVAGFALAWWQFNRAQETGWTGGDITLPGWGTAEAAGRLSIRRPRPFAALFWKELQLQQAGLLGMAGLFLVHLGVVWLRKIGHYEVGELMKTLLEVFAGIWFIVPVVIACMSIAEERRLGTTQELLTLSVSIRKQFLVKFVLTLVIGGILSAMLAWTAEWIGSRIGAGTGFAGSHLALNRATLMILIRYFMALALIGFYASSVARGIVQALAAAIATATIFQLFAALVFYEPLQDGPWLFSGYLVVYIGLPVLTAVVIWLSWKNFRSMSENWRFWRRNILGIGGAMLFIVVATTAIYNRTWESVMSEPAHGPARMAGPNALKLKTDGGFGLAAILPGGRLWVDRITYEPGKHVFALWPDSVGGSVTDESPTGFFVGGKWISLSGDQILSGSNWVAAVTAHQEIVGIRDDGTLWVSEKPHGIWDANATLPAAKDASYNLVRFGDEADWKSLTAHWGSAVTLLKRDGTLWFWHPGYDKQARKTLGLRASKPELLSDDSDWERIAAGPEGVTGWKKDGTAWAIRAGDNSVGDFQWTKIRLGYMQRVEELDHARWLGFADYMGSRVALREDGTLWTWSSSVGKVLKHGKMVEVVKKRPMTQIGKDTDWAGVAGNSGKLFAIKTDGTLWAWHADTWFRSWDSILAERSLLAAVQPPVRQGSHKDWVAVGYSLGGVVAVAADGSLWFWGQDFDGLNFPQPMLAPSRRPMKIENIFGNQ